MRENGLTPGEKPDQDPEHDPDQAVSASLWRRVLARAVDGISVFFILWVLSVLQILWFVPELLDDVAPRPWDEAFVPLLVYIVLSAAYEIVFVRWNVGQTPGKQALHIRVVQTSGAPVVALGRAAARWILPGMLLLAWPLWLGVALVGLTAISAPFDSRRRAVHDHLAATRVIAAPAREPHPPDDDPAAGEGDGDGDGDAVSDGAMSLSHVLFGGHAAPARRRRSPRPPR